MTIHHIILTWLICLLPRAVCRWLWSVEWLPLGPLAPYIFGRVLDIDPIPVSPEEAAQWAKNLPGDEDVVPFELARKSLSRPDVAEVLKSLEEGNQKVHGLLQRGGGK